MHGEEIFNEGRSGLRTQQWEKAGVWWLKKQEEVVKESEKKWLRDGRKIETMKYHGNTESKLIKKQIISK